jgi:hypothetical protein
MVRSSSIADRVTAAIEMICKAQRKLTLVDLSVVATRSARDESFGWYLLHKATSGRDLAVRVERSFTDQLRQSYDQ